MSTDVIVEKKASGLAISKSCNMNGEIETKSCES